VVKSPVAIPVAFQTSGGRGGGFPSSIMGVLALRSSGLAGHRVEHQGAGHVRKESSQRGAAPL